MVVHACVCVMYGQVAVNVCAYACDTVQCQSAGVCDSIDKLRRLYT